MATMTYEVEFDGLSDKDANLFTGELERALARSHRDVKTESKKKAKSTQDLGTILVLILGADAVVAVAKGIADYLRLRQSTSITIATSGGVVIAKNLTDKTAVSVIEKALATGGLADK